MRDNVKLWFVKNTSEFALTLLLTLIFLLIGYYVAGIEIAESIQFGKMNAPIYIILFLFLYKFIHCSFPGKDMMPGK